MCFKVKSLFVSTGPQSFSSLACFKAQITKKTLGYQVINSSLKRKSTSVTRHGIMSSRGEAWWKAEPASFSHYPSQSDQKEPHTQSLETAYLTMPVSFNTTLLSLSLKYLCLCYLCDKGTFNSYCCQLKNIGGNHQAEVMRSWCRKNVLNPKALRLHSAHIITNWGD